MGTDLDPRDLRTAFGKFATGVTVITSKNGADVHGMTANSFTSVSIDPPILLVCVANKARTQNVIKEAGRFGVSVLASDQVSVSNHFAGKPEFEEMVFASLGGVPTIKGAIAQFSCTLIDAHAAGDHTIFVGEITGYAHCEGEPLMFHDGRYLS